MIEGILYPITGHHLLFALLDCSPKCKLSPIYYTSLPVCMNLAFPSTCCTNSPSRVFPITAYETLTLPPCLPHTLLQKPG